MSDEVSGYESQVGDEAVREATGKGWNEWFALLDAAGAAAMPHPGIAVWLSAEHAVPDWWAQGVTVAFEQRIGRRQPGQRADGTFSTSATRRVAADQRAAFDAVLAAGSAELAMAAGRTNTAAKYWSASWPQVDGSAVGVRVSAEPDGRALVALEWRKLASRELVAPAKQRLVAILDALAG